ncbi:site-specific integrase [Aureibaculum algae]|uniref:Site-specific integrase n=1 Tax=Aureibaculum algae TaxID=2584122 RepID=A0A5B7TXM5_9FLAO|nr:site-specific integrase [Aureibaculum algae]QCX40123.1 site-specific integrase [Aureibaculum algae]
MTTIRLKTLFVISKSRINKKGFAPILCRLTYFNKRKSFATGLFINPQHWESKQQKAKPLNKENDFINTQLSLIKQNVNQAFLFLQVNDEVFSVEDVYLKYKGKNINTHKTLLEVFELHNNKMVQLIGIEYTKSTYSKFIEAKNHTVNFIKYQHKKNDIQLESLNMNFLSDLDFYLKTKKNQKQITINKTIQRVRKIVKLALAKGYLKNDPFLLYKPKKYEKKVVYLSQEELDALQGFNFTQSRLQQVKHMFIFCCYTGLAYQEMADLKQHHLIKGFDGNTWIEMVRRKTQSKISIPLLPEAEKVIKRYKTEISLLPIISNQKFNSYLKEIAAIVGIEKRLTHHIARKTFATTILLYNDIPMEIVSELLGHSSITITQNHYAKVVQHKISEHISVLKKKLNN